MNLLFVSKAGGCKCSVDIGHWLHVVSMLLLLTFASIGLIYIGYKIAQVDQATARTNLTAAVPGQLKLDLEHQRRELELARSELSNHVGVMTQRLGQLQAQVIRLEALGKRLVTVSGLDEGEFDFDAVPALGGPISDRMVLQPDLPDLATLLERLTRQLEDREQQFSVLTSLMLNRSLQQSAQPAGRPVEGGWISSHYGRRSDPFTGKNSFHDGIDIAGKSGSTVVAVASGIVTYSGNRANYGKLVEVSHGNDYVTRYAHNQENLVAVGDMVKQGDPIARMGSSGRSTGPHLHFEVLQRGRTVNPVRFIRAPQQTALAR
jgi:murein DD-endopeptidase MepM/ murein hydrolase activator NlpD